ncbi:HAMP domain-containing histidine kinase [Lysobacter enzymogenes]|nr:HAMP domain-containing histidine kinase [Lysobacter enzymogenes]
MACWSTTGCPAITRRRARTWNCCARNSRIAATTCARWPRWRAAAPPARARSSPATRSSTPASTVGGCCAQRHRALPRRRGGRRVRVDPGLQQALINLINNAADANAAAGVDEPVEVETGMREGRLNIAIRDRGAGPARIARPRRDHPGSGLGIGLLISKSSIERSRGTVKQSERDGGGCVTEVELPLVAEGAA